MMNGNDLRKLLLEELIIEYAENDYSANEFQKKAEKMLKSLNPGKTVSTKCTSTEVKPGASHTRPCRHSSNPFSGSGLVCTPCHKGKVEKWRKKHGMANRIKPNIVLK